MLLALVPHSKCAGVNNTELAFGLTSVMMPSLSLIGLSIESLQGQLSSPVAPNEMFSCCKSPPK